MSNFYDKYRKIQQRRQDCRDEWSAAFLSEGGVAVKVTNYRLGEEENAGLIINDKEGPDDVILFSNKKRYKDEEFVKGDYFIWENTFYLIYEDVKLVNKELKYKKQRAVECNVTFKLKSLNMIGAFISTLRRLTSTEQIRDASTLLALENPLLIIPRIDMELVGERMVIGGKPWRISDYDSITNLGVTYLYLEKDVLTENEIPVYKTEEDYSLYRDDDLGDWDSTGFEIYSVGPEEEEQILYALKEYTFDTKDGYFAAVPSVDIVKRTRSQVTFMIPFWGEEVFIQIKNQNDKIEETIYRVVSL